MTDEKATPGLLPPSAEPIPPAGMQPGEDFWYEPPVMPQPGESRYWVIRRGGQRSRGPNGEWANLPDNSLLFDLSQNSAEAIPRWVTKHKIPKHLDDFNDNGSYAVSQRVLDVFREFDPEFLIARRIAAEYAGGDIQEPAMYLILVTRRLPIIDFANSRVKYKMSEGYSPFAASCGPARLMPDMSSDHHLIVDASNPMGKLFVSDAVKQRLEALTPKLYNVKFSDPAEPYFFF